METFGNRLYDSLITAGMSDAKLAAECRVDESDVTGWLKMSEAELSGKSLAIAGLVLNVSCRWLALGTGSPSPIGMEELRAAHSTGE